MSVTKKYTSPILGIALAGVLALTAVTAHADTFGTGGNTFTIPFVPIGNAGNVVDSTGYGAVSYNFSVSEYLISQDNMNKAVASGFTNGTTGDWIGSQPATTINWFQAAAFVNWLNMSQGYAAAYNLDSGATMLTPWSQSQAFPLGGGMYDLYRNANAHYFLPSENEYYKAAFYDPNQGGPRVGGYWLYATGSNTAPTPVASGTAQGTAVYDGFATQPAAVDQSGGLSPYGTEGQTGNVYEWMESSSAGDNTSGSENREVRAGSYGTDSSMLQSSNRFGIAPSLSGSTLGFRVVSVTPVGVPAMPKWGRVVLPVTLLLLAGYHLPRRRTARPL